MSVIPQGGVLSPCYVIYTLVILWIMPNINITVNGASKQLSKLNLGKAAGPDNLTSRILKELHSEVVPMLTDIFNSSLREGKVPDDW